MGAVSCAGVVAPTQAPGTTFLVAAPSSSSLEGAPEIEGQGTEKAPIPIDDEEAPSRLSTEPALLPSEAEASVPEEERGEKKEGETWEAALALIQPTWPSEATSSSQAWETEVVPEASQQARGPYVLAEATPSSPWDFRGESEAVPSASPMLEELGLSQQPELPQQIEGAALGPCRSAPGGLGLVERQGEACETSSAREGVDPPYHSLAERVAEYGGSPRAIERVRASVESRVRAALPDWGREAILLRDPLDPTGPALKMDDRAELQRWEDLEEYRVWMQHSLNLALRVVTEDLGQVFTVRLASSSACNMCLLYV
jgi:hypothetical protein